MFWDRGLILRCSKLLSVKSACSTHVSWAFSGSSSFLPQGIANTNWSWWILFNTLLPFSCLRCTVFGEWVISFYLFDVNDVYYSYYYSAFHFKWQCHFFKKIPKSQHDYFGGVYSLIIHYKSVWVTRMFSNKWCRPVSNIWLLSHLWSICASSLISHERVDAGNTTYINNQA